MLLVQFATIVLMFVLTFVIYKVLGPPKRGLLYTRDDRLKWDDFIRTHSLGGVLTTLNVVGTLTSLAGCYVFLMGSSKLFGVFILMCSVTLIPGAYVTNFFSQRIMASSRLQKLLDSPNQTGGVIAALFWSPEPASQWTARLVKWISLLNLAAVLWMEFTVFASIGAQLLGFDSVFVAPLLLLGCCFAVALFTLIYGLRGFVFADLFHVPLVALAAVALLVGCITLSWKQWDKMPSVGTLFTPSLAIMACVLFALHNIFLNGLQLLTTEGHWLRLWIFRAQETKRLALSTVLTGIVWGVLSVIGLLTFYLTDGQIAVPAIATLLNKLADVSGVFIAVFWMGGIAALFSTSDSILYASLMVANFRPTEGVLRDQAMQDIHPLRCAALLAVSATVAYIVMVQFLALPLEQLVFLVFSIHLNLFPAFVRAYRGLPQSPWYIVVSFVLYTICAVTGILQSARSFEWTLAATLMPLVVALAAGCGSRRSAASVETGTNGLSA